MRPRIEECAISRPSSRAGSGGVEVKEPSLAHVLPSTVRRHRSSSTPRRYERSLPLIRCKPQYVFVSRQTGVAEAAVSPFFTDFRL